MVNLEGVILEGSREWFRAKSDEGLQESFARLTALLSVDGWRSDFARVSNGASESENWELCGEAREGGTRELRARTGAKRGWWRGGRPREGVHLGGEEAAEGDSCRVKGGGGSLVTEGLGAEGALIPVDASLSVEGAVERI